MLTFSTITFVFVILLLFLRCNHALKVKRFMKYQLRSVELTGKAPINASLGKSIVMRDNLDGAIEMPEPDRLKYFNTPVKYVSAMSLLLCVGGMIKLRIGAKDYSMGTNDVMLLSSGVICDIKDVTSDAKFWSVSFKEEFCSVFTEHLSSTIYKKVFSDNPICSLSDEAVEEYTYIYRLLRGKLNGESETVLLVDVAKCYLQGMLFGITSDYLSRDEDDESDGRRLDRKKDLYNRFVELVRHDFTSERGITYYATRLCVTPRYLSQVVYQESGYLAGEFICRLVITEAKQLVQSQQYSIKQISQMLNFTSVSFFSRYFKKLTGYSPKEYQKMWV